MRPKGTISPSSSWQASLSQHHRMAVLVAFANGPNLKVWWNKPQGSLEKWRQGACSQVHVQGGGQSFRMVWCRGESPGDNPTRVYEEPSLWRQPCTNTILPSYPNVFLFWDLYTAWAIPKKSWLKGQERPLSICPLQLDENRVPRTRHSRGTICSSSGQGGSSEKGAMGKDIKCQKCQKCTPEATTDLQGEQCFTILTVEASLSSPSRANR